MKVAKRPRPPEQEQNKPQGRQRRMNTKRFFLPLLAVLLLVTLAACGDPDAPGGDGSDVGAGVDAGGDPAGTRQCEVPSWDGEGSPPPTEMYEGCVDPGDGPENPDWSDTDGSGDELPDPGPSPVEPQPGQENVHPLGWEKAKPAGDGMTVDVIFWSGVEPCYVLDRVEVEYRPETVVITLLQGSTPSDEEVACIDIALKKVTTVELEEPLRDRKLVDGAS